MAVVASFTTDLTVSDFPLTFPLTVNFTDTSTGSPDSWWWDFGDGYSSEDQNPFHTYSSEGTFNITFYSWKNAVIENVPVSPSNSILKEAIIQDHSDPDSVNQGWEDLANAEFVPTSIFRYVFFSTGAGLGKRKLVAGKTTYTVNMSAFSAGQLVFAPLRCFFNLSAGCGLDVAEPSIVNPFKIFTTSGQIVTNFASNDATASFQFTVSEASDFTNRLITETDVGCFYGYFNNVTLGPPPTIKAYTSWDGDTATKTLTTNSGVDFTGDPLIGFTPLDVTFSDTSFINIVSWKWDFGDGNTSTQQNPTNTYINNT